MTKNNAKKSGGAKTQSDMAAKAMKLKTDSQQDPTHPTETPDGRRDAEGGMNPVPRSGYPVSGALDAEGHKPVVERTRKVR